MSSSNAERNHNRSWAIGEKEGKVETWRGNGQHRPIPTTSSRGDAFAHSPASKEIRSASDRRRTPRYPFIADAEIVEKSSGTRVFVRISELSLYGCFLDIGEPIAAGSLVLIKIFNSTDFFEAEAVVMSSQPNLGMRLAFRKVEHHFHPTLKKWLQTAMQQCSV
jgi:hypothetical protein